MFVFLDVVRFQILTDDQTKLVFEVKKDDQGKSFLLELNKAIGGEVIYLFSHWLYMSSGTEFWSWLLYSL